MRSPTDSIIYWIALVVGLLGVIGYLVTIPVISGFAFWLVVAAFVLFILMPMLEDTLPH